MNSNGSTQTSETPMNISDYVNLDFDFEALHHGDGVPSEASMPGSLHGMSIDHTSTDGVGFVEADFTGLFQLFDGSNALDDPLTTTGSQMASENGSSRDAREALIAAPTSLNGVSVSDLMQEDSGMTDAFESLIDPDAWFGDYTTIDLGVECLSMADVSQTKNEREPSVSVPINLKTQQNPSRWVPVSQQLQQHFNMVYASQLVRNLASAYPAPVLYFPAQGPLESPVSSIQSLPSDVHPQLDSPQVCQPGTENPSIEPSLLMHESTALPPQKTPSDSKYNSTSPAEGPSFFPIKKRAIDASESDLEPAPKRIQNAQAEALLTFVKDDGSGDEPKKESDDQSDNESEDDTKDDSYDEYSNSDSSGRSSASPSPILPPTQGTRKGSSSPRRNNPSVKKGPYWRYEQAREARLRTQRRERWNGRRAKPVNAMGEPNNRHMQRLLEEIEDTEEFAEAQGYKVEENSESDKDQVLVRSRPVRKGARKSYVGQV